MAASTFFDTAMCTAPISMDRTISVPPHNSGVGDLTQINKYGLAESGNNKRPEMNNKGINP